MSTFDSQKKKAAAAVERSWAPATIPGQPAPDRSAGPVTRSPKPSNWGEGVVGKTLEGAGERTGEKRIFIPEREQDGKFAAGGGGSSGAQPGGGAKPAGPSDGKLKLAIGQHKANEKEHEAAVRDHETLKANQAHKDTVSKARQRVEDAKAAVEDSGHHLKVTAAAHPDQGHVNEVFAKHGIVRKTFDQIVREWLDAPLPPVKRFDESGHPRAPDGKFGEGSGGIAHVGKDKSGVKLKLGDGEQYHKDNAAPTPGGKSGSHFGDVKVSESHVEDVTAGKSAHGGEHGAGKGGEAHAHEPAQVHEPSSSPEHDAPVHDAVKAVGKAHAEEQAAHAKMEKTGDEGDKAAWGSKVTAHKAARDAAQKAVAAHPDQAWAKKHG